MPRVARIVAPGTPHHILQRGNRQQRIFFTDANRRGYLLLLGDAAARENVRCLAWCLMDNHLHLVLVPPSAEALRSVMSSVHTSYAQRINRDRRLTGHLFQGRYASYAMDDRHLMVGVRYIENNPVTAGLVERAEDWPWSSARAHIAGMNDGLTDVDALREHVPNWRAMLADGLEAGERNEAVERALRTGRWGTVPKRGQSPA